MGITALLMAAGTGERFGEPLPKQFGMLGGRPTMIWSASLLAAHAAVKAMVVVAPPGREGEVAELLREWNIGEASVVAGGATRQESVMKGLVSATEEMVIVHDAVRPCMSQGLLDRVVAALETHDAVIPAVPAVDTLYHLSGDEMDALLDRTNIAQIQTPQGFRRELLLRAHTTAAERGYASSDDGSLVFSMGGRVHTVPGEKDNIKITFKADVALARAVLVGRADE